MGSLPRTTAVVPCYNPSREFLTAALQSAAEQSVPVRIVVVDDGSTPAVEIPAQLCSSVDLIRTENRGLAAARNRGIAAAQTEFVAFLDSDDRWAPTKTERQQEALDRTPAAPACFTQCVDAPGYFGFGPYPPDHVSVREFLHVLWYQLFFPPSATMVRLSALKELGGFAEELRISEDIDLFLRLLKVGPIVQVPEPLTWYRVHGAQMTNTMNRARQLGYSREAKARAIERHGEWLVSMGIPRARLWRAYEKDLLLAFFRRQFGAVRGLLWQHWTEHPTEVRLLKYAVLSLLPPSLIAATRDRGTASSSAVAVPGEWASTYQFIRNDLDC